MAGYSACSSCLCGSADAYGYRERRYYEHREVFAGASPIDSHGLCDMVRTGLFDDFRLSVPESKERDFI